MWQWSLAVALMTAALQPVSGAAQPGSAGTPRPAGDAALPLAHVIRGADGAEMALVPAGEFWMGSTAAEVRHASEACRKENISEVLCTRWFEREVPRHRVALDAYHLDRHEVTGALFERFTKASGHVTTAEREGYGWVWQRLDGRWRRLRVEGAARTTPTGPGSAAVATHPVVQVSWHDADAYCRWAGKRLPTEAEWEKAARGPDGRRYPWGDVWDASKLNAGMTVGTTTPVGAYPAGVSPYGIHDMAGGVWEWVGDWFAPHYYGRSSGRNPRGPDGGERKVARGGSFDDPAFLARTAFRNVNTPDYRTYGLGFRCARGAGP